MKFMVVGWDVDEQQAFWDVVPVAGADSVEEATEKAIERFNRLRGRYAVVVDVMTTEAFMRMALRVGDRPEEGYEADYAMLEREGGILCSECDSPCDNGEGWDGLCGNCADRAEAASLA